jgi:hypothetical protein
VSDIFRLLAMSDAFRYRLAQYLYGLYLGLNGMDGPGLIGYSSLKLTFFHQTALPFLIRTELLLSPLLPLFAAYVVSLVGFNVAKYVLTLYFG